MVAKEPGPIWAKRAAAQCHRGQPHQLPESPRASIRRLGGEQVQGAKPKSLGIKPTARQKANTPGLCTRGYEQEAATCKATGSFSSPRPRYHVSNCKTSMLAHLLTSSSIKNRSIGLTQFPDVFSSCHAVDNRKALRQELQAISQSYL